MSDKGDSSIQHGIIQRDGFWTTEERQVCGQSPNSPPTTAAEALKQLEERNTKVISEHITKAKSTEALKRAYERQIEVFRIWEEMDRRLAGLPASQVAAESRCSHQWKLYEGVMHRFHYCEKCDEKDYTR